MGRSVLLGAALLILCFAMGACVSSKKSGAPPPEQASTLPRANPGYVQWLERQSMLRTALLFTAQVSGTERTLLAPSVDAQSRQGDRLEALLTAADTWLWIHPPTMLTMRMRPVWEELRQGQTLDLATALGLRGLHTAPTAESGSIWEYDRKQSPDGEDSTSLDFAPHMGGTEAFERFAAMASARQWQMGMDIIPAATGLGPDFFLAARGVREFPGIYMMLEAPEELHDSLPHTESPWIGAPLGEKELALLTEKGLLPPALARDHIPWATRGGWAVTGPIRGADGAMRRWLYRYHGQPGRSPLHWDDPSGNARKIFSASIIRQVGVLQQTLTGIRLEALMGLDAAPAESASPPTLEPGPSALRDLTREIRRYGGWSAQMDPLPPDLIPAVLQSGADFTLDTLTAPLAENALKSGNTKMLRDSLQKAVEQGLDQRRLLRFVTALDGPGALAPAEDQQAMAARHKALALFRGGMPGLLFITGQDLAGTLPLESSHGRGAWSLLGAGISDIVTRQGVEKANTLYPSVQEQLQSPGSFADTVRSMTTARQKYGIASARVHSLVPSSDPASLGLWLTLPDREGRNSRMLLLCNFSSRPLRQQISLPKAGTLRDLLTGQDMNPVQGNLGLELAPYEVRWLLLD